MILRNAIQTPDGTILESFHRHDYKSHIDSVNNHVYGVDGGHDYLRRFGPPGYKELTVHDDGNHETRRNNLKWGQNFDKEGNKLPETKWALIKDLTDSHLDGIINYLNKYTMRDPESTGAIIYQILLDEVKYRKESKAAVETLVDNTVTS